LEEKVCEACGVSPARITDSLCADCSHTFAILTDILGNHPELDSDKFDENITRIGIVYKWRAMRERNLYGNIRP